MIDNLVVYLLGVYIGYKLVKPNEYMRGSRILVIAWGVLISYALIKLHFE